MNLQCESATIRPTVGRCIEQIAERRTGRLSSSCTGFGADTWFCVLGDKGHVHIWRNQMHLMLWEITEIFAFSIGDKKYNLTRAEIHALCRVTQGGSHHNFARITPEPPTLTRRDRVQPQRQ